MPADLTEVDPDFCSRPGRVGVPWHSWRFDGDDRRIICQFCGEMRDSDLPRLCSQCAPVVALARHLEHVGTGDLERAAESKANSCPDCYRLNGRTMR